LTVIALDALDVSGLWPPIGSRRRPAPGVLRRRDDTTVVGRAHEYVIARPELLVDRHDNRGRHGAPSTTPIDFASVLRIGDVRFVLFFGIEYAVSNVVVWLTPRFSGGAQRRPLQPVVRRPVRISFHSSTKTTHRLDPAFHALARSVGSRRMTSFGDSSTTLSSTK
jgi:hypothetical protein